MSAGLCLCLRPMDHEKPIDGYVRYVGTFDEDTRATASPPEVCPGSGSKQFLASWIAPPTRCVGSHRLTHEWVSSNSRCRL